MSQSERQLSESPMRLATIILAIVTLFLFASVVSRAINIVELKRQQAILQATQRDLAQTIEKLSAEAQYLQSDSYLEQVTHSVFFWGRPGEKLLIPLDSSTVPAATPVPPRRP